MVSHAIIRDEAAGETRYEAALKLERSSKVTGFRFAAGENDGFPDGRYQSSPVSYTLPALGHGDLVFLQAGEDWIQITGQVTGVNQAEQTRVHAFSDGQLVASDICDADGMFELWLPVGAEVYAVQGNNRSAKVRVDSVTKSLKLSPDQSLGSIRGRVVRPDTGSGVNLANVIALQDGGAVARVTADDTGAYAIEGLDAGVYDVTCHVAGRDTIHKVEVEEGKVSEVRDFDGSVNTVDREAWSDEVFAALESVFYYWRDQPFNAEDVATVNIDEHTRHTIMLSSARGERFPAYLALPKSAGPFPCLVTLHAGSIIGKERSDFEMIRRRMTRVGYAVAAIDAKLFNVRREPPARGWNRQAATIQTVVDYRRLIDYLSSRSDIDSTRIGIYGGSMGTFHGTLLAGIDDRVKAYVMRGPGLGTDPPEPVVRITDNLNYVPRIPEGIPKVVYTGYYDRPWAVQGSLRLISMLGEPTEVIWHHTSHTVPPQLYMDHMVEWVQSNL